MATAQLSPLAVGIPSATLPQRRNATLDAVRILAALFILWMHTWQSMQRERVGNIGRFAVPFFATSAIFLLAQSLFSSTFAVFTASCRPAQLLQQHEPNRP
jgi:hypothetical protein